MLIHQIYEYCVRKQNLFHIDFAISNPKLSNQHELFFHGIKTWEKNHVIYIIFSKVFLIEKWWEKCHLWWWNRHNRACFCDSSVFSPIFIWWRSFIFHEIQAIKIIHFERNSCLENGDIFIKNITSYRWKIFISFAREMSIAAENAPLPFQENISAVLRAFQENRWHAATYLKRPAALPMATHISRDAPVPVPDWVTDEQSDRSPSPDWVPNPTG